MKQIYSLLTLLLIILTTASYVDAQSITENKRRTFALIVGISEYQDPNLKLDYAASDAANFYDFLKQTLHIPEERIHMLPDAQAKYEQIIIAFDLLNESMRPGDQLFFYFSGHGDVETSNGFDSPVLLLYDAAGRGQLKLANRAELRIDDLNGRFAAAAKKGIEVNSFIDACRAGSFSGKNFSTAISLTAQQLPATQLRLLSCQAEEFSVENDSLRSGLFTHFLIKGLSGCADTAPKNGTITAVEISHYLQREVSRINQNQYPILEGPLNRPMSTIDPGNSECTNQTSDAGQLNRRGLPPTQRELAAKALTNNDEIYNKFQIAIAEGRLVRPADNCAYHYFRLLDQSESSFRHTIKRTFIAALLEKSSVLEFDVAKYSSLLDQGQKLWEFLNNPRGRVDKGKPLSELSKQSDEKNAELSNILEEHIEELDLATLLQGKGHSAEQIIHARRLFWAGLIDLNDFLNPDRSDKEDILNRIHTLTSPLSKFRKSLEYEPTVYTRLFIIGLELILGEFESAKTNALGLRLKLPKDALPALLLGFTQTVQLQPDDAEKNLIESLNLATTPALKALSYIGLVFYYKKIGNGARMYQYFHLLEQVKIKGVSDEIPSDLIEMIKHSIFEDIPIQWKVKIRRLALAKIRADNITDVRQRNGQIYQYLGEFDMGYEYLRKDSILNPRSYFEGVANLFNSNGQRELANTYRLQALRSASDSLRVDLLSSLGHRSLKVKDYRQAKQYFQQAMEEDSGNAQTYCDMGDYYSSLKESDSATYYYRRAVQLDKSQSSAIYYPMISHYVTLGDYESAIALCTDALRKPGLFKNELHKILVDLLIDSDNPEFDAQSTASYLEIYISKNPTVLLYEQLAELYRNNGEEELCLKTLELGANRLKSADLFHALYKAVRKSDEGKAITYLRRAMACDPSRSEIYADYARRFSDLSSKTSIKSQEERKSILMRALAQPYLADAARIFDATLNYLGEKQLSEVIDYLFKSRQDLLPELFESLEFFGANEASPKIIKKLIHNRRLLTETYLIDRCIGRLYELEGNYNVAKKWMIQSLENEQPRDELIKTYACLAKVISENELNPTVLADLLKKFPIHTPFIHFELGNLNSRLKKDRKAIEHYLNSLNTRFPVNPRKTYLALAHLYDKEKDILKCVIYLDKAFRDSEWEGDLTNLANHKISKQVCNSEPYRLIMASYGLKPDCEYGN
jgi:hypothetical protein